MSAKVDELQKKWLEAVDEVRDAMAALDRARAKRDLAQAHHAAEIRMEALGHGD